MESTWLSRPLPARPGGPRDAPDRDPPRRGGQPPPGPLHPTSPCRARSLGVRRSSRSTRPRLARAPVRGLRPGPPAPGAPPAVRLLRPLGAPSGRLRMSAAAGRRGVGRWAPGKGGPLGRPGDGPRPVPPVRWDPCWDKKQTPCHCPTPRTTGRCRCLQDGRPARDGAGRPAAAVPEGRGRRRACTLLHMPAGRAPGRAGGGPRGVTEARGAPVPPGGRPGPGPP